MSRQEKFEAWFEQEYKVKLSRKVLESGEYDALLVATRKAWQAATAQAVPEGYVLVPAEPTYAMHKAFYEGKSLSYRMMDKAEFYDDYSAMIQAAQEG